MQLLSFAGSEGEVRMRLRPFLERVWFPRLFLWSHGRHIGHCQQFCHVVSKSDCMVKVRLLLFDLLMKVTLSLNIHQRKVPDETMDSIHTWWEWPQKLIQIRSSTCCIWRQSRRRCSFQDCCICREGTSIWSEHYKLTSPSPNPSPIPKSQIQSSPV